MKRLSALLLALILVIGTLPVQANAGTLDNGLVYYAREDHVEITGYTGSDTELVIPSEINDLPVTIIGPHAFYGCSDLTSVVIPDGVTTIHNDAFWDCTGLTSIKIPDSVTFIGIEAFMTCSSLTSIDLPDGITSIGYRTFDRCSSLTSVEIPDGVTYIGGLAFWGCYSLTSIDLPDSVTFIDDYAFCDCSSLTSIDLPDSVTFIGSSAFMSCTGLTSVEIPDSVTFIGSSAFYDCSSLTSIEIPDGVTSIEEDAFAYCSSLTSVEIPDSITSIGNDAFRGCVSLTSIDLPDSVTSIGEYAFLACTSLTSIDLPDSVTSIGDRAFDSCDSLTGIHVDENNPNYSSDDRGVLFDKTKTLLIRAPGAITGIYTIPDSVTTIYSDAFSICSVLTGIEISDSVTSIGEYAFYHCTSLTSIDLPDELTSIERCIIGFCTNLTSIEIPASVTSIGIFAFYRCDNLTRIYFNGDAPVFDKKAFENVYATAYYPADNPTWTKDVMLNYYGYITWVPYDPNHTHDCSAVVTAPTCTEPGYTTYTCACGYSYVADNVDALGHEFADGVCTRCGVDFNPFTDVPDDAFYYESVLWALENGITTGATDTSFAPDGQCLRAHVVTFLHRAAENPEPGSANNPFTDVKTTDFFYKPVLWAVEEKITNGVSADKFGSYDVCNRAAVVTFLWRAAGSPEPASADNPFTDVKPTDFFYKPVLWAVENSITNGLTATEFGPTAACNRAQVVTFLYRAYN